MAKRTNRVAWTLMVILAAAVLISNWVYRTPRVVPGRAGRLTDKSCVVLGAAVVGFSVVVMILVNLCEMRRGDFRWYREGLFTLMVWVILAFLWWSTCTAVAYNHGL